jgi:hypothetical protein
VGKKARPKKKSARTTKAKAKAKPARRKVGAKRSGPGKPAGHKTWIVTTSSERPIGDVARDLARAGFTRTKVLGEIGSIVGSARDEAIVRARGIRGVAAVEPETPIDIGPPGSPTTW